MGILDSLVGKKDRLNIEEIKSRSYQQKYGNACRFIWKKYDMICDKIGKLQEAHSEPIVYKHLEHIRR